jgi:hypothetical protein
MKRLFVTTLATALTLAAPTAFASDTAKLYLQGTVSAATWLNISATNTSSLTNGALETVTVTIPEAALITAGQNQIANIAYVFESCNDLDGYTVKAISTHNGNLTRGDASTAGTPAIAYALTYAGTNVDLTGATPVSNVGAMTTAVRGASKAVGIKVTGNANALAGTYQDTVTFTITAK